MDSDVMLIDGKLCTAIDEGTLLSMHGLDMSLPVSCDLCYEKFNDLNVFDNHMLTHSECHSFFCQFCNNTYHSWGNLVAHRKACHNGKVLSCEGCEKRKIHRNLGPVNYPVGEFMHGCEECNEGFSSMPQLIRHYTKKHHHNSTEALHAKKLNMTNTKRVSSGVIINLICPICKCIFLNLEQLSTHVKTLCKGYQNRNNICPSELYETQLFTEDVILHNTTNVANLCGEFIHHKETGDNQLSVTSDYDNNEFITKQFVFKCPFCLQECPLPTDFLYHMKLHTSKLGEENVVCKLCNTHMKNQKEIVKHLKIKHWDNLAIEYQNIVENMKSNQLQNSVRVCCEYCGREFNKKETLLFHIRRHLGERPYKCKTCKRFFYTSQQLTIHKHSHIGGHLQSSLTKSSKSHHGHNTLLVHRKLNCAKKTYTCSHCNRQFLNQSSYMVHVRLHTGHRSFTCSFCKKIFTLKSKLNMHLETNHSQVVVENKCSDCGTCFKTAEQLANHCNEESCVTLVTLTEGNKSEENDKKFQIEDQYIIRFSDHDL